MARLAREEVFSPDEVAIVHVMNRVVRRCFLLGIDELTGKNYDHRKVWIEDLFQQFSTCFGIDLLCFSILSNHFHLILRSRPDVVATWDDTEVARRWWLLCPVRKRADGSPEEPNEPELNSIRNDPDRLAEIRRRLSDISWWMRLLCQRIATRANAEDGELGKFWQNRFRAVRLLDEEALLACAAYVDLNPIRAAMAGTLEESDFTSIQRRIRASGSDCFLAPLSIGDDSPDASPSANGRRCSDNGFLQVPLCDYVQLLDWLAQQTVTGKRGATSNEAPPILQRLSMDATVWSEFALNFGRLFYHVAGKPQTVDGCRSRVKQRRFNMRRDTRRILSAAA